MHRSHPHARSHTPSTELSPTQRRFLDLPSPYHYNSSRRFEENPYVRRRSGFLSNVYDRIRYSVVDAHAQDLERRPSFTPIDWDENTTGHSTPWYPIFSLSLLLSVLINLFLLFGDRPITHARHPSNRILPTDRIAPHDGFHLDENGMQYTCYQTKLRTLHADYDYASTRHAHDYLWDGLQPDSKGAVYTSLNRPDNKTRRAGLAMFHQLDCLAGLRSAIQEAEEADGMGEKKHRGLCLDYLRQIILCNADDSIEISGTAGNQLVSKAFGSRRVCRDPAWLYDVTSCGVSGCKGREFYHSADEMDDILQEEETEAEATLE